MLLLSLPSLRVEALLGLFSILVSSSAAALPLMVCSPQQPFDISVGASEESHCKSYTLALNKGETLAGLIQEHDLLPPAVFTSVLSSIGYYVDLRKLGVGTQLNVTSSGELTKQLSLHLGPLDSLLVESLSPGWSVAKIHHQVTYRKATFSGLVESSLWESADKVGMDPKLIADLSEIFAWQLDFSRELRANDRWRISVDQILVDGKAVGFGPILAAEFENRGEIYSAVRFEYAPGRFDYFSPDGQSLKRMFLKSPIKFARISSRFMRRRFHPVLRTYRPHNGVDYAAPPGTPVMSVGSGRVQIAGRRGGSGIMVKVRHNGTYETAYLHLRAIAKGIGVGGRVEQGQVIGYVGSTGLATGPHLHFSFYENGRYVDPLGRKFPSKDPVPRALFASFSAHSNDHLASLPEWGGDQVAPKG